MDDQPTCGKGLAEHAALPGILGEVMAAVAENLETHMEALDLTDENSKQEYDAYVELAREHRQIAGQLKATAQKMAGYRDLPMGRHDEQVMAGPKVLRAFEALVRLEQKLLTMLQHRREDHQKMLTEMGRAGEA
jgi:hypothetical protein